MSGVVEVVDSVDSNGQCVEEDPTTNKMKKVVTDILIHWYPVCGVCGRGCGMHVKSVCGCKECMWKCTCIISLCKHLR